MTDAPQAAGWRVSSRCESLNCVEVHVGSDQVIIRDSAARDGLCLEIHPADWMAFLGRLADGQLGSRPISGADRRSTS